MNTFSYRSYFAFISYAHADKDYAIWVRRRLEAFKLHKPIQGTHGSIPAGKLGQVFQDEAELGAAADLGEALQDALSASKNLIVICSRTSAQSRWVNEEIRYFKRTWIERHRARAGAEHGGASSAGRIIAIVPPSAVVGRRKADEKSVLPAAISEEASSDEAPETIILAAHRSAKGPMLLQLIAHLLDAPKAALSTDRSNRTREVAKLLTIGAVLLLLLVVFAGPLGRSYLKLFGYLQ